jgi:hypothetical protein
METKTKKINKKRLFVKALEDGLKKAVELAVIGFTIGISAKLLSLTVLAVFGGSIIAKVIKLTVLENFWRI